MHANIGIPEQHTKEIALELNKLLANEFVLYAKTRNYHWNIEGDNFLELHKFYETQFEQLDEIIDEVAERIRTIGHYAEGRLKDCTALTDLVEQENTNEQKEQLQRLLDDHETIVRKLRPLVSVFADTYRDFGSSDFVTGLMEKHEKMAWFIRSHLK
jgi:starvation-inducible DNA-binding protein